MDWENCENITEGRWSQNQELNAEPPELEEEPYVFMNSADNDQMPGL